MSNYSQYEAEARKICLVRGENPDEYCYPFPDGATLLSTINGIIAHLNGQNNLGYQQPYATTSAGIYSQQQLFPLQVGTPTFRWMVWAIELEKADQMMDVLLERRRANAGAEAKKTIDDITQRLIA